MKRFLIVLGIVALAAPVMAQNSLTVNTAAAIDGTYGAEIYFEAWNNLDDVYVQTDHPTAETTYVTEFKIDVNTLDMPPNRYFILATHWNTQGVSPAHHLFLYFYNSPSDFYRIVPMARSDGGLGNWGPAGIPICDHVNLDDALGCNTVGSNIAIKFEWAAASAPGANDGYIKAYRSWDGGATYPATPQYQFTGIDNDTYVVDSAKFGANFMSQNGHGGNTMGSWYFDTFVSTR